MAQGILLDENNDLLVADGHLVVGERTMQDAYLTLSMNQGDLKDDPLTGVNLTRMIRGRADTEAARKAVEVGLERVGIRFDEIRGRFEINVNK